MMIETERLFLREMTMDDFGALYAVLADPEIMRHYPYAFDEGRVRDWIERNIGRYRKHGFGLWAVCLKPTGEMIGDCGLALQCIEGETLPEIGYHIRRDCQRKGYAREAAAAVRDWAFAHTDYPALYSYCKHTNVPSFKTAEAIGMRFWKEYPDAVNEVTHVSRVTRPEWEQMRRGGEGKEQAAKQAEAYLFGQVLGTHSFLLKGGFPEPDAYAEIGDKYFLPGGETGTAATVLSSLGVSVRMDGTWIGTEVGPMLRAFYADKQVDLSPLRFREDDPGVMDYVIIAGLARTPMGRFQTLFSTGERWWSVPKESDIAGCRAAAIDPYFREESLLAAEICLRLGIPYVTIDSRHDTFLHRHAAINVVSRECTQSYGDMAPEAIMACMQRETDGLTILTQGGGEMLYGRRGESIHRMRPFRVEVKSTLGAGDTFKAGCVWGLLRGLNDEALVRFASACSAVAISRFPLPLYPPTLPEVEALIGKKAREEV